MHGGASYWATCFGDSASLRSKLKRVRFLEAAVWGCCQKWSLTCPKPGLFSGLEVARSRFRVAQRLFLIDGQLSPESRPAGLLPGAALETAFHILSRLKITDRRDLGQDTAENCQKHASCFLYLYKFPKSSPAARYLYVIDLSVRIGGHCPLDPTWSQRDDRARVAHPSLDQVN